MTNAARMLGSVPSFRDSIHCDCVGSRWNFGWDLRGSRYRLGERARPDARFIR